MTSRHLNYIDLVEKANTNPTGKFGGVEFFLEVQEERIVIALAGSDSMRDLFTSLRCWTKCGYHAGYIDAAFGVFKKIVKLLRQFKVKSRRFVVTGHSLGAGVALPLAYFLNAVQYKVQEVVLFGAPGSRVRGDPELDWSITNYAFAQDPLPFVFRHLPPPSLTWLKFPKEFHSSLGPLNSYRAHKLSTYKLALKRGLEAA